MSIFIKLCVLALVAGAIKVAHSALISRKPADPATEPPNEFQLAMQRYSRMPGVDK